MAYNFQNDVFINTGYRNNRRNMQLIVLDSKTVPGMTLNNKEYNNVYFEFSSPLVIDQTTDVFLEYIHLQNVDINGQYIESSPFFCIDIPELDFKTVSNNDYFTNKYILQNETFGETDLNKNDGNGSTNVCTMHIKPKNNYMSTIESKTIAGMHLSITSRDGFTDSSLSITPSTVNGKSAFSHFQYNYLANKQKADDNFRTCGAVKLVLYLQKRDDLNKQVPTIQNGDYTDMILQNARYFNDRTKNQMIVLDSTMSTTKTTYGTTPTTTYSRSSFFHFDKIKFNLTSPLIIDTKTEVYLEYVSFNNQVILANPSTFDGTITNGTDGTDHLESSSAFYLDIPELNFQNFSNNSYLTNKCILPNEIYGKSDNAPNDDDSATQVYFMKLKKHFIGIINPGIINSFTVSITGDDSRISTDDYYFLANKYDADSTYGESSVQIAFILNKVW